MFVLRLRWLFRYVYYYLCLTKNLIFSFSLSLYKYLCYFQINIVGNNNFSGGIGFEIGWGIWGFGAIGIELSYYFQILLRIWKDPSLLTKYQKFMRLTHSSSHSILTLPTPIRPKLLIKITAATLEMF